ncbi:MAG: serine hydrolase domain-containing protein [Sphingomicrobium sp.]
MHQLDRVSVARRLLWRAFLTGLIAAPLTAGEAQQPNAASVANFDEKAAMLDELFRSTARTGGTYVLSYRADDRNFVQAYGSLDCGGLNPMRADALFDGGSLTKNFTMAAIFKLVESGRLKLDDRLGELFRGVPADKGRITVAQLIQHRSGIPNFIDGKGRAMAESEWSIETYDYAPRTKSEMLRLAWRAPLQFQPGTRDEYSNYGFTILAAVVEAASGRPYEAYLREQLFVPLGMNNTGYLLQDRRARPVAEQCRDGRSWGDPYRKGLWAGGISWNLVGAGGMYTTADDLQKWSAGIASGALFRSDIQRRFDALYFAPSYRCGTDATAMGGSNGMTRSLILHLPRRREAVVMVATHRQHGLPPEDQVRAALCGR